MVKLVKENPHYVGFDVSQTVFFVHLPLEAESDFCQGGFDRVSLELPVRIICHLCGNVMVSIWMYPARLGLHV